MNNVPNSAVGQAIVGSADPATRATKQREKALEVAQQFEEVFVRSLVSTMRQSSSLGGEESGLFGAGPGADTYSDWFDQHMSDNLMRDGGIGITDVLMREFERHKQIPAAPPASTVPTHLPGATLHGGFDVIG